MYVHHFAIHVYKFVVIRITSIHDSLYFISGYISLFTRTAILCFGYCSLFQGYLSVETKNEVIKHETKHFNGR